MARKPPHERYQTWNDRINFWREKSAIHSQIRAFWLAKFKKLAGKGQSKSRKAHIATIKMIRAQLRQTEADWKALAAQKALLQKIKEHKRLKDANPSTEITKQIDNTVLEMDKVEERIRCLYEKLARVEKRLKHEGEEY